MPQLIEPTTPEAQREVIRLALDELAAEVATSLRDAHLDFQTPGTHWRRWHVLSTRPTETVHMQRSSVASSGNDWVTLD